MYEGSMIGAGAVVFAVMGYVIAKQVPDAVVGAQVELNPKLLAFVLGESEEQVGKAIAFLCEPDAKSRTPESDGRRLVKLGEYAYQVVNGAKYNAIRDEEQRRAQNREAKRRERARKPKSKPLGGETANVKLLENEGQAAADQHLERVQAINGGRDFDAEGSGPEFQLPPIGVSAGGGSREETPAQRAEREYLESRGLGVGQLNQTKG